MLCKRQLNGTLATLSLLVVWIAASNAPRNDNKNKPWKFVVFNITMLIINYFLYKLVVFYI
jgi:hypothetical protein